MAWALEHFDATALLEGLSAGIVVLDRHLCAIYANDLAQKILGFSLDQVRGRPFGDVIGTANGLMGALRKMLDAGEELAMHGSEAWPTCLRSRIGTVGISTTLIRGQITGTHLLLEVGAGRAAGRLGGG